MNDFRRDVTPQLRAIIAATVVLVATGCVPADTPPPPAATVRLAPADTAGTAPDTTLTGTAAPPPLALVLPAPPGGPLDDRARALADLAVFAPRTTRWFIARRVDSIQVAADIGRLDAPRTPGDSLAVARMLAAESPVQPGLPLVVHDWRHHEATEVTVTTAAGRRLVATAHLARPGSTPWVVVEARTARSDSLRPWTAPAVPCDPGDGDAIATTVERLLAGARRVDPGAITTPDTGADSATARGSAITGCFGAFRAVVVRRPATAAPDVTEKAWLLRPDGRARTVRLRDLSYPLHDVVGTVDVDGDGTDELLVRSYRPAMETVAALRMTDSVTFTRFASGFTVERR